MSLGLLRELQKKDLRKPNSILMAKTLVASKWGQSSFRIKLDADWLISGCLNNLITVRQKSETSIFLDSPLCLTLKMNYSYWRSKKWEFSFTEGKFCVWLQTAIIYAAPLNIRSLRIITALSAAVFEVQMRYVCGANWVHLKMCIWAFLAWAVTGHRKINTACGRLYI